jgi:hypothetical protein
MKSFSSTAAIAIIALSLLGAGTSAAAPEPIPHQSEVSPQRSAAEEWVRYMNRGNQRAACELQTTREVNGQSCDALPTQRVLHCPRIPVGQDLEWLPKKSELRRVFEQVGKVTDEGNGHAFAVLNSQREERRWRGALGLEMVEGAWRISYLRQGAKIYVPAGSVWMTDTWRKLWYPPICPRRAT